MTALEVAHSKTAPEISSIVTNLQPSIDLITNYTSFHRTRLIKPAIGFDDQALALSFVPAASDTEDDHYTYHHLRRDLWERVHGAGVEIGSRYVAPSAHLTIGRFVTNDDFFVDGKIDSKRVQQLVKVIDETNEWLEREYWPSGNDMIGEGGEWIVGQEFGLDCRIGTL